MGRRIFDLAFQRFIVFEPNFGPYSSRIRTVGIEAKSSSRWVAAKRLDKEYGLDSAERNVQGLVGLKQPNKDGFGCGSDRAFKHTCWFLGFRKREVAFDNFS